MNKVTRVNRKVQRASAKSVVVITAVLAKKAAL